MRRTRSGGSVKLPPEENGFGRRRLASTLEYVVPERVVEVDPPTPAAEFVPNLCDGPGIKRRSARIVLRLRGIRGVKSFGRGTECGNVGDWGEGGRGTGLVFAGTRWTRPDNELGMMIDGGNRGTCKVGIEIERGACALDVDIFVGIG